MLEPDVELAPVFPPEISSSLIEAFVSLDGWAGIAGDRLSFDADTAAGGVGGGGGTEAGLLAVGDTVALEAGREGGR